MPDNAPQPSEAERLRTALRTIQGYIEELDDVEVSLEVLTVLDHIEDVVTDAL